MLEFNPLKSADIEFTFTITVPEETGQPEKDALFTT